MDEHSNGDIRARLRAKKEAASKRLSTTLPVSGETVTYPAFIGHDQVMAASKIAGKNRSRIGMIVAAQVCLFDGQKLTVDEIGTLLTNRDTVHLIDKVLGEDDDASEGDGGN